jgi:hypothetical protein
MARPVCKRFLQERPVDQSASTYPASETCSLPRWRYARSGPHKIIGVQRRVFLQDSRPPFDCHCQAILWSTSRKPFMRDNWLSNRVFKSHENLLDHCCDAWNKLVNQPWRIISIGMRDWAHRY